MAHEFHDEVKDGYHDDHEALTGVHAKRAKAGGGLSTQAKMHGVKLPKDVPGKPLPHHSADGIKRPKDVPGKPLPPHSAASSGGKKAPADFDQYISHMSGGKKKKKALAAPFTSENNPNPKGNDRDGDGKTGEKKPFGKNVFQNLPYDEHIMSFYKR